LSFRIEYSRRAQRSLRSFNRDIRRRILEKMATLHDNPFPRGVLKLRGEENVYLLRIGDYQVLYEVYLERGAILIVKIDHRSIVYGP